MDGVAYQINNSLYLNLTNRCTNQCEFCIRYKTRELNQKYPLWLDQEPTVEEIITAVGDPSKYEQIVFCGYGEPLLRLEEVKAIAAEVKSLPAGRQGKFPIPNSKQGVIIRIDTNGLANLYWGRNILPELKGLVDIISISLNAENTDLYERICSPLLGPKSYAAVIDFIKAAKDYIPEVEATVVDLPIINIEKCRKIAEEIGVKFRVRPYYEVNYVR